MKPSPSESRLPFLLAVGLTVLGVGAAYRLVGMPPLLGAEDAAIGFRYARNLAEGHGIVFNPGGERVEGFTSMLWLLVSAAVYRLSGPETLETTLLALSLAITFVVPVTVLWLVADVVADGRGRATGYARSGQRFGRRLGGPGVWLAALWLAAQPGFWFWSALSLMDVAIWAAGLATYLLLIYRRMEGKRTPPGSLVLLVVALVLIRPEAMLVVPATAVIAALVYGLGGAARRATLQVLATCAVSVGALTGFRVAYFGHPLPNTYYAKVSPDVAFRLRAGLVYVWEFLAAHPLAWVGVVALVATPLAFATSVLTGLRRRAPLEQGGRWTDDPDARLAALASGLVVVGVASIVWGGGDHYQGHRFLQAYLPLVAIPLAVGVEAVHRGVAERSRPGAHGLAAAALIAVSLPIPSDWTTYRDHGIRRQAYDVGLQGRYVGATLANAFEGARAPELGLWMVGGAGYAYTGPVKDLLGLNWIAMGMSPGERKGPRDHAAFDVDVFWSAPPELMIPEPEAVLRQVRCVRSVLGGAMHGVLTSDRFRARFVPVRVVRGEGEPIIAYGRRDWVATAPAVVQPLGWAYCDGPSGGS